MGLTGPHLISSVGTPAPGKVQPNRCQARIPTWADTPKYDTREGTGRQAQTGAGYTRVKVLCQLMGLCCRTNSTGREVQPGHRQDAVEAPGQWYLEFR